MLNMLTKKNRSVDEYQRIRTRINTSKLPVVKLSNSGVHNWLIANRFVTANKIIVQKPSFTSYNSLIYHVEIVSIL